MPTVYTIGHSNHPLERFIGLLKQHTIEAVADVRSAPYSRINPQYKKQALRSALRDAGIDYVFLGKELGARSDNPDCYVDGRVNYDLLARTALFQSGLEWVIDGAGRLRVALMCAEKEPLHCHRTILVARALEKAGARIVHILADGGLEPHSEAMDRLAAQLGLSPADLFSGRDEVHRMAYTRQAEKMVYNRPKKPGVRDTGRGAT